MTWHVQPDVLARYASGDAEETQVYSVEAHLSSCAHCREQVAALVAAPRLNRLWDDIQEELDAPRLGPVEDVLVRVGVPRHAARLLGATPALRLSWLLACALVLVFAVWGASRRTDGLVVFLALAPLLPLAAIAAAYGPDLDPTYEIGLAAPMHSFRLLLIRALAVLVTTTATTAVASLALPGLHWSAAAWLAPSLGLTLTSLALATRLAAPTACGSVAVVWLLSVAIGWRVTEEPLLVFGPAGQLTYMLVAVIAAAVLARNTDSFERRGGIA